MKTTLSIHPPSPPPLRSCVYVLWLTLKENDAHPTTPKQKVLFTHRRNRRIKETLERRETRFWMEIRGSVPPSALVTSHRSPPPTVITFKSASKIRHRPRTLRIFVWHVYYLFIRIISLCFTHHCLRSPTVATW